MMSRERRQEVADVIAEALSAPVPGNVIRCSEVAMLAIARVPDAPPAAVQRMAIAALLAAVRRDGYEPVYRLRASTPGDNPWTPKLRTLCKVHRTPAGESVDGRDPDNIIVAFRKLERKPPHAH